MSKNIRFKRGNKTKLPSSAPSGTPLWCEDTEELYIGTGSGTSKVGGDSVTEALVNQKLTNYVPKTQLATKNQAGIAKIGNNLAIRDGVVSGIPIVGTNGINIARTLETTLSINKSNSNMNVTHNYTGTKNSIGVETVNLTIRSNGTKTVPIAPIDPLGLYVANNYIILSGKLYYYNSSTNDLIQITTYTDWTFITTRFALRGIGLLYLLTNETAQQVGTYTDWKTVSGTLGIRKNGTLHHLIISSVSTSQIGTDTDWDIIGSGNIGNDSSSSNYSFGIKTNGQLYMLIASANPRVIDTNTDWTMTTGWAFGNADYAFGVRKNLGLYSITYTGGTITIEQRSTISNWKQIQGYSYGSAYYGVGITEDGYLYRLHYSSSPSKYSSISNAKMVTNTPDYGDYCYCLTEDGKLYSITDRTTCKQLQYTDWEFIVNATNNNCFAVRAGCLYYISKAEITKIKNLDYEVLNNSTVVKAEDYNLDISGQINNGNTITLTYDTIEKDIISHNVPYVISQTVSGAYHCRIWSNKFCEQWGQYSGSGKSGTVTIPKAYKDTNYVLVSAEDALSGATSTDTEGVDFVCLFSDLTTSSFRYSSANGRPFTWYTAGYIN